MIDLDSDILYYADSNPAIGMGHLARGLAVLNTLSRRRPDLRLTLAGEFSESALNFLEHQLDPHVRRSRSLEAERTRLVAIDTMFDPQRPEYVDRVFCEELTRRAGVSVLVAGVMELEVPLCINAVINHLPEAELKADSACRQYLGFDYVPVTRDFLSAAETRSGEILLMLGGNDLQDGPSRVLECIGNRSELTVLLSPHFPAKERLSLERKFNAVRFEQNVKESVRLLAAAGKVICTYGNATYESLTLHKPTFVVNYKPFQDRYASYLEQCGLLRNLGLISDLTAMDFDVLSDADLCEELIGVSREVFTSAGIDNIADVLEQELANVPN